MFKSAVVIHKHTTESLNKRNLCARLEEENKSSAKILSSGMIQQAVLKEEGWVEERERGEE